MRAQIANRVTRIHNQDLPWQPAEEGQIQVLPTNLGNGCSKLFHLTEELTCIETHITPLHDLRISSLINDQQPRMVLTLGLQGSSRFDSNQGEDAIFKAGFSTLTTFNGSHGCRFYKEGNAVSQLRFSMSKRWLEQQFGGYSFDKVFRPGSMQQISHRPLSKASIFAVQQWLTNSLNNKTIPMFRHGQAMSILASELNHLFEVGSQPMRLSERDKKIAKLARDILSAEFKSPPTIDQLCKRLGTNQSKLKQLFHSCYGTTPYSMLLDIRMTKAHQLLNSKNYSVSLVAEAVGYNHISNFCTAFHKYYGFTPKQTNL